MEDCRAQAAVAHLKQRAQQGRRGLKREAHQGRVAVLHEGSQRCVGLHERRGVALGSPRNSYENNGSRSGVGVLQVGEKTEGVACQRTRDAARKLQGAAQTEHVCSVAARNDWPRDGCATYASRGATPSARDPPRESSALMSSSPGIPSDEPTPLKLQW